MSVAASGRVVIEPFESACLRGNALGDNTLRRVPVYLPPGYDAAPERRYPLVLALAGFTGTGLSYLNYDFYQPNLPTLCDALIASGDLPPCIIVMVDGMTALGGNQYIDSPAVGPWARHVCEELVPWAEGRFRCLGGRAHRGVFGKSSGGFGALRMGMDRSDVFAAVASHSGDCYFDYCYVPEFPAAIDGLRRAGGVGTFLEGWRRYDKLPGWMMPVLDCLAMSAFYSPDAGAPHGFELPFDLETGELSPRVFGRWQGNDPVRRVETSVSALRSLAFFYFDCGQRDEFRLHHGARILSSRCEAAGIPHAYETFDDGHRSVSYRYKASLPRLVRSIL